MIDSNILRNQTDRVRESVVSRKASVDVDALLRCDAEVRTLQSHVDELRHGLKSRSKGKPTDEERTELQRLSQEIKTKETELATREHTRNELLQMLPNLNDSETPIGESEADNVVVKIVGEQQHYDFQPKPYHELASVKPLLKCAEGVRTSGSRFYYLTGKLAQLQRAVFDIALEFITRDGFELIVPPILVRERAMFGTGHFPADRSEIYEVNPGDDNLFLVGTAEVPLVSLHDGETLSVNELPKKYVAQTCCFRREAGSYGKDQAGILRVHQFQKIEMVALTTPNESRAMHERIRALEEKIVSAFGLHFRVVDICTGDLGYPAARKWDIEAWFPSQQRFRELTSTSNTTDFQTRRLNIGHTTVEGQRALVHSVNGTGVTDRLWLAILEQNQRADGAVVLPPLLSQVLGWDTLES